MRIWDALIVGGGPAGLSAALMLGRSRRSVLVLDAGEPRNRFADGMHGVLGLEGMSPRDLATRGRAEVARYGVEVRDAIVTGTTTEVEGVTVTTGSGETFRTRALIVATGLADELPPIPGMAELWGRAVLHCPYCHGWEVRDRRLAVVMTSPASLHQASLLRQLSDRVTVFTHGRTVDEAARAPLEARGVEIVDAPVVALQSDPNSETGLGAVLTADGVAHPIDAVFVGGTPRPHDALLDGLDLTRAEGVLSVDERGATSHPRIWAVGNIVSAFANVPVSMGQGSLTGAAVNAALAGWDADAAVRARTEHGEPATFWEERYAGTDRVWSGAVNPSLAAVAADLAPGTAVDLGCGEGGDAIWLAERGWRVTGVDISSTAIERARTAAAGAGLSETARFARADLGSWAPDAPVDLVTASFLHSPVELPRIEILRRAAEWIAPGGHLLVVSHAAPPPWAGAHRHEDMSGPDEDLDALALDPARWETVTVEVRAREATGPDGVPAHLDDGIILLRRR